MFTHFPALDVAVNQRLAINDDVDSTMILTYINAKGLEWISRANFFSFASSSLSSTLIICC